MTSRDFAMGMVYLFQTLLGTLGNFSLLSHCTFSYFPKCRSRHTDLILKHLVVANCLVILCKGVPQTMAAFGMNDFLDDLGCKLLFYLQRVGRGVSMGSTCLLSVFQSIMIHPRTSRWAELQVKAPKYVGIFNILCWILNILVNTLVLMYLAKTWSNKNATFKQEFKYCSGTNSEKTGKIVHAVLTALPDVGCLGLMFWASASMVIILHRHKHQVQHIHSTQLSHRSSPEDRATKTVLSLVSTFVSLYMVSSIFHGIFIWNNNPSWFMVNMAALVTGCFPAISPYLLMSRDCGACGFCFVWIRNPKPLLSHSSN